MNIVPNTWAGLAAAEIELFRTLLCGLPGHGVEIGCCDGFSTAHILESSRLNLTVIDPFVPDSMAPSLIGDETRFRANVEPWKDRVALIKNYSHVVSETFSDALIDFLFIDGDHAYEAVRRDFDQWTPRLRPGGLLAIHDSRMSRIHDPARATFHPGPSAVACESIYQRPTAWEVVGEAFSLTVARKL
jgi:predicted O-methyltransferase YrrM